MNTAIVKLGAAMCVAAAGFGGALAFGGGGALAPTTVLFVGDESSYESGCAPPCFCFVQLFGDVGGAFGLTPAGANRFGTETFSVDGLSLEVSLFGDPDALIVAEGFGTLRINEARGLHRMDLILEIGGGEPGRFSSGWQPISEDSLVDLVVSNDVPCTVTNFRIVADVSDLAQ